MAQIIVQLVFQSRFCLRIHPSTLSILHHLHSDKSTTIDLTSAYYQIPLHHRSHKLTAMRSDGVLYEFSVLPFKISSAPALFQDFLSGIFGGMEEHVSVYLDDIIIHLKC